MITIRAVYWSNCLVLLGCSQLELTGPACLLRRGHIRRQAVVTAVSREPMAPKAFGLWTCLVRAALK
jgi:hypothetical protein